MTSLIQRYERNTTGRDMIVGDVHGHFTRLQRALDIVGFEPGKDRLFSVGDLVDRGPESHDALHWLSKTWFRAVRGNHEDMAIRWGKPSCQMDASNYAMNGGGWNIGNTPHERATYSDAFEALPLAIELQTSEGLVGIVHAGCPFDSWTKLTAILNDPHRLSRKQIKDLAEDVMWSRDRIQSMDNSVIGGVRAVVVGHTPVRNVTSLGNTIFIDTAGWHPRGGGFTILDTNTLKSFTVPST